MKKSFISFAVIFLFLPVFCRAQTANQGDVVINEIAWMGSTNSAGDQWMELKNTTGQPIDFTGWTLKSADGKLNISLKGTISANGFYLLERTDDNSVPNITADVIYKGALSNTGQDLTLYDFGNNVIDRVNFSAKWPAGNNTTKQTMEKTAAGWQTSSTPNGTPKAENSAGAIGTANAPITQAGNNPISDIQNPAPVSYPDGILINELLPSPKGADESGEWIELYNTNNVSVDLSGWKIQDTKGITTTYVFPQNTTIASDGYLVLKRPDTNIMLNNDQDGVNLLLPNEKIVDSVAYINAPINQSYNNALSGWSWSTTLTPGTKNIITAIVPPQKKITTKSSVAIANVLPKTKKTANNKAAADTATASVSDAVNTINHTSSDQSNPWLLFLIALGSIVVLGVILLVINIKFNIFKKFNN